MGALEPGKSRQTSNSGDANWDKLLPGAGSDLDAACGRRKGKQALRAALEGHREIPAQQRAAFAPAA